MGCGPLPISCQRCDVNFSANDNMGLAASAREEVALSESE